MKRLDSHAAVISQGQSHTPLSPPSLIPCRLHCSFVALAAGGAVRLESAPPWLSLLHNKAVTYSTLLCPLPSITHLHTSTASHCSILRQPAAIRRVGTSALRKVSLGEGMKCLQMKRKIKKDKCMHMQDEEEPALIQVFFKIKKTKQKKAHSPRARCLPPGHLCEWY